MSTTSQSVSTDEKNLQYAGFWLRFCSMFLDGVISLPAALPALLGNSVNAVALGLVLSLLFQAFVDVYLVRRFGGSPGKLIMGLQILKTDGCPVTYREAILRCGPDLFFGFLNCIAFASVYSQLVQVERTSSPMRELAKIEPTWYQVLSVVQNFWTWGELLALLTNEKRRALHDFIAGTVVVIVRKPGLPKKRTVDSAPIGA